MADPLASLIARRYSGRGLPVAVVLPSGERVALSRDQVIELKPRLDKVHLFDAESGKALA